MFNKALLMAAGVKRAEPMLLVKWNTFPVNDDYSVYLTIEKEDGGQEVVTLDGLDGTEGLSFPMSTIKSKPTYEGHFHISNSKMSYGFNTLNVIKAENLTYNEELGGYDDYIYCTVTSLDKDALFEFNVE